MKIAENRHAPERSGKYTPEADKIEDGEYSKGCTFLVENRFSS